MTDQTAGRNNWLDAVESNDGFCLRCPNDHGWLPPQDGCPRCGSTDLNREQLPTEGTVETYTEIRVLASRFEHRDTIAVAIADFGPVRVTGQLSGFEYDAVERGDTVTLSIEVDSTTDERVVVFRPSESSAD